MIPFIVALGIYLVGFSLLTYACIFADTTQSPLAQFVTIQLPNLIFIRPIKYSLGEKKYHQITVFISEWIQVIIYQCLITASWSIVFSFVYPEISISTKVSAWPHQYIGVFVCLICIESWRRVFHSSPGYITYKTIQKYNHYPYDHILFFPDATCPTLGIPKLPRSKFDRYYFDYIYNTASNFSDINSKGRHVPRFDHYCGWVKNNIGEENYRDFLIFIMIHFGMCLYGSIIIYKLLVGIIERLNLFEATFINVATGEEVHEVDFFLVGQYLTMQYFPIVGLGILLSGMSLVLGFFVLFHLYITSRGMTTNEFFKWRDVRKLYRSQKPIDRPRTFPLNMYDNGIIENFKEVIWPKSLYPSFYDSQHRGKNSEHEDQK